MDLLERFQSLQNEGGKIKDWYGKEFIDLFCKVINQKKARFSSKDFKAAYLKEFKTCEMKERLNLISALLDEHLKGNFKQKLEQLKPLLGESYPEETGMMNYGYHLYPVSQFIENHAEQDIDASLAFIYELTQRFTGEWAIRTVANYDPKHTLKTLKAWSKDENFHVRRLASEGLRARLPWGKKIEWACKAPEKTLPIYNALRNDKVLYVRRSVANAMGDLIKINDDLAYATFEKWLSKKKTKENVWVIKHAIRTPVKKGVGKYKKLKESLEKICF